VVDLEDAAFDVIDVNGLAQVLLIELLLRREMGDQSFDELDKLGHGESFNKVG
jgi:hypothetical protein